MRHKIINDPVHGFINIEDDLLLKLVDHPWVQRTRRIRQLGMTSLVYPGAQHTRFQHATGAMHLMQTALDTLAAKGVIIMPSEYQAALAAILLHDVGHGPFSHALERLIVDADHESISSIIMSRLNEKMGGTLDECIRVFSGDCRPFLHQLISSQLDTDRLDYLRRDSFFSGVVEGTIGSGRIIKMLDVTEDWQLAVEAKGIYTIEDFLVARRLMYWQVYLHKTVVAAENMLRQALFRARTLMAEDQIECVSPSLSFFLENKFDADALASDETILDKFCELEDDDVTLSLKTWMHSKDRVLSYLCRCLFERNLFHIELSREPFSQERISLESGRACKMLDVRPQSAHYLVMSGSLSSKTYSVGVDRINILYGDGTVRDISEASDLMRLGTLSGADKRYYLCYPREFSE